MNDTTHNNSFLYGDRFYLGGYILAIFFVYLGLHGIYQPDNIDDAWYLSFSHNHIVKCIETDVSFGAEAGSGGYGGVVLFGKTFTYLYGHALNLIGWTKSNAHLISTMCIVLSAACWIAILHHLKFGRRLAVFFGLSMLLSEPFFKAGNVARPDSLCFLVVSAALFLFLRRRYGFAGFLSMVAIEIHPVGISAFLFIASVVVSRGFVSNENRWFKWVHMAAWLFAGTVAGVLYYVALHINNLNDLSLVLSQGNTGSGSRNILFEYFFKTKYFRHIPEFVAIVICVAVFVFKRYYRENSLITIFLIASLLFTVIICRPNFSYVIYVYPAFILLFLWVFERQGRLGLAAGLLLVYLLPQYGFVYWHNRHWDMEKYLSQVRSLIPAGNSPIMGMPNDWFAFVDRPFFIIYYLGDFRAVAPDTFVLVDRKVFRGGTSPNLKVMTVVDQFYESTECGRFQNWGGEMVIVKQLVRKREKWDSLCNINKRHQLQQKY